MSDLDSHRPVRSQQAVIGLVAIVLLIAGVAFSSNLQIPKSPKSSSQATLQIVDEPISGRQVPGYSIRAAYREAGVHVKMPIKTSASESVFIAPNDAEARQHWEMMHQARIRAYSPSPSPDARLISVGTEKDRAAYAKHREKLVESGYITKLNVKFKHLLRGTKESSHFVKLLMKDECPELLDFESAYRTDFQPLELEVWYAPGLASEWRRFFAEHDRSNLDYNFRFMSFKKVSESD